MLPEVANWYTTVREPVPPTPNTAQGTISDWNIKLGVYSKEALISLAPAKIFSDEITMIG